jgi:outer membrane protein assembly factor BamB
VRGTNFVATVDRVYVIQEARCHVLDAKTGQTLQILSLPDPNGSQPRDWGYLGVCDDCIIAGSGFAQYSIGTPKDSNDVANSVAVFDKSASRQLVVMNRHTGQVLWTLDARRGFLHNAIAAGQGKVFCLDAAPPYAYRKTKGTSADSAGKGRLLALDLLTGKVVWENEDCAFGSWLSYSQEHDILLQAYRKSRDMPWEPGDRMAALRGATGQVLWDKKTTYNGPCILHGDTIITQESAYSLTTGQPQMREHPLTGQPVPWKYSRNYGCHGGASGIC